MPLIFVDRRKTSPNKSAPNRQKLIRRIKSSIKSSLPKNIGYGSVDGTASASSASQSSSPIAVAAGALEEPAFVYDGIEQEQIFVIGNDEFERDDLIDVAQPRDKKRSSGPGPSGEDDFIINIARDEFLDLFFEDCELPNLINNKYTEKLENTNQHAGFSTSGNPAQLSIIRTYKQAFGRRRAMLKPVLTNIERLKEELASLNKDELDAEEYSSRWDSITKEIALLEKRKSIYGGFDNSDLRYRKTEAKPLKTVDAVLIMAMDISGSMDQEMKICARRWFSLLYSFIKRRYQTTELIFIAHTDEAFEMSENDFFSTRLNGGTRVSPALHLINKIIKERYDPNETNIYVSHASDGDNWYDDSDSVIAELTAPGNLLSKIQMFNYIEIEQTMYGGLNGFMSGYESELWTAYASEKLSEHENKIILSALENADDCYNVFRKIFKKV